MLRVDEHDAEGLVGLVHGGQVVPQQLGVGHACLLDGGEREAACRSRQLHRADEERLHVGGLGSRTEKLHPTGARLVVLGAQHQRLGRRHELERIGGRMVLDRARNRDLGVARHECKAALGRRRRLARKVAELPVTLEREVAPLPVLDELAALVQEARKVARRLTCGERSQSEIMHKQAALNERGVWVCTYVLQSRCAVADPRANGAQRDRRCSLDAAV